MRLVVNREVENYMATADEATRARLAHPLQPGECTAIVRIARERLAIAIEAEDMDAIAILSHALGMFAEQTAAIVDSLAGRPGPGRPGAARGGPGGR